MRLPSQTNNDQSLAQSNDGLLTRAFWHTLGTENVRNQSLLDNGKLVRTCSGMLDYAKLNGHIPIALCCHTARADAHNRAEASRRVISRQPNILLCVPARVPDTLQEDEKVKVDIPQWTAEQIHRKMRMQDRKRQG